MASRTTDSIPDQKIGATLRRVEDARFLTGTGRYVDDISPPGAAHACVVRSPYAHARIGAIDASAAVAAPGVLAVLTAADLVADGLGALACAAFPPVAPGAPWYRPLYPALAGDKARHVGDRIALVVAETAAAARDAAELVAVDYDPLDAVSDAVAAADPAAPKVWDEAAGNTAFAFEHGDRASVDAAFATAAHVARVAFHYPRASANAIEPRACVAEIDSFRGRLTLATEAQAPHRVREVLAETVFHVPQTDIRVVSPDIGGGFGMKGAIYPEEVLTAWAARRLDRPVKWTADRSECLMSDIHGRDQHYVAELALDADGRMLALRVQATLNVGAYLVYSAGVPAMIAAHNWAGPYDVRLLHIAVRGVFTNTNPVGPYRGTTRPETCYALERLVETAAREMKVDPVALRRRNIVPEGAMPYRTVGGQTIDAGAFERMLDAALDAADHGGFAARRTQSAARGLRRGFGLCLHVESSGLYNDRMEIRVDSGGSVQVHAGTLATGQGHETMYAQLVAEFLGVPVERVRVMQGDTDRVAYGRGTFAERSAIVGGSALRAAADEVIVKGRRFAAAMLEAAEPDIEFADGQFRVAGTDRAVPFAAVARTAHAPMGPADQLGVGLSGAGSFAGIEAFPNGCMVAELEIDPDTGAVRIDRFTAVDDVGVTINPMMVDGQIHGSVAQGAGAALLEEVRFDPESGQLVTGSFMDYAMPRADDLPMIDCHLLATPTKSNPLGVKGAAEPGNIAAPPAVVNAILDALADDRVTDIALPATPERVWRAIREAKR